MALASGDGGDNPSNMPLTMLGLRPFRRSPSCLVDGYHFLCFCDGIGCDLALDDFGTGFGSFTYLKYVNARYLKIDLEFVRHLTSNDTDQKVVRSIVDIAESWTRRRLPRASKMQPRSRRSSTLAWTSPKASISVDLNAAPRRIKSYTAKDRSPQLS